MSTIVFNYFLCLSIKDGKPIDANQQVESKLQSEENSLKTIIIDSSPIHSGPFRNSTWLAYFWYFCRIQFKIFILQIEAFCVIGFREFYDHRGPRKLHLHNF